MKLVKNGLIYLVIPLLMGFIGGIMSDYTGSGFDQFLQRPIEQTIETETEEKSELDFDSIVSTISTSKINSGVAISKNGNLKIDFNKGEIILISEGEKILLSGRIIKDENGNEIGRISSNGLVIQSGKISIFNNKNSEIINSDGLISTNNFETKTIYDDKTYEIAINDPSYKDMGSSFNLSLNRDRILIVFASAVGSTDTLTEPTRMILSINNSHRPPEGIVNSTTAGTATLFYVENLKKGEYNLKLRYGKGVVATQAGILEGLRFSYILI